MEPGGVETHKHFPENIIFFSTKHPAYPAWLRNCQLATPREPEKMDALLCEFSENTSTHLQQ